MTEPDQPQVVCVAPNALADLMTQITNLQRTIRTMHPVFIAAAGVVHAKGNYQRDMAIETLKDALEDMQ